MQRKMHAIVGETKLEAYTRIKTLEIMKLKHISVYKLAHNCPHMSESGIYKCLNDDHKAGLQFLETLCQLAGLTVQEFYADFENSCYLEEAKAAVKRDVICQIKKGDNLYERVNKD